MEKIGVIINPYARKIGKKGLLEKFTAIKSPYVDMHLTKSLDEVTEVLKKFKKDRISYLGIAGGDGSMHNVVSRAVPVWAPDPLPPIVVLKGGTMDNISRSIKLRGKGPAILNRLIATLEAKKPVELAGRNTMDINGLYCFIFGIGVVPNFLTEVYKYEKGWGGNFRVIRKVVSQCLTNPSDAPLFQGITGEVVVDGKTVPFRKVTGMMAGTVEHVSPLLIPTARANEDVNAFHVVTVGMSPGQILLRVYNILRGIRCNHPHYSNDLGRKVEIRTDRPFMYTMDGDLFEAPGELTIKMGPRLQIVKV